MTATGKRAAAISALERYFDDCDADAGDLLDALAAYLRAPEAEGGETDDDEWWTCARMGAPWMCRHTSCRPGGNPRHTPAEPQTAPYCAPEAEGGATSEQDEGPEVDTSDWRVPPEPESVVREKLAASDRRIASLLARIEQLTMDREYRDASTTEHDRTVHSAQSLALWAFADEIAALSPARPDAERCGTCGDRRVLPGCPADCSCDLLRRECRVERPCPDCTTAPSAADEEKPKRWGVFLTGYKDSARWPVEQWVRVTSGESELDFATEERARNTAFGMTAKSAHSNFAHRELPADAEARKETNRG